MDVNMAEATLLAKCNFLTHLVMDLYREKFATSADPVRACEKAKQRHQAFFERTLVGEGQEIARTLLENEVDNFFDVLRADLKRPES